MAQLNDLLITGKTRALNPINGSCTNGTTVTTQTQSTKFMREDGTWSAPSYMTIGTTSTTAMAGDTNVNNVTQTKTTTNANYEILFSGTADNTTRAEGARKTSTLLFNPSKDALTVGARRSGNTIGDYSVVEGVYGTASAMGSHAEGLFTISSGDYSHVEGQYTTAQRRSQHVFGEYNILDTGGSSTSSKGTYIEIVGNGTSQNALSNARTLDWSGNEVLAGTLTCTDVTALNTTWDGTNTSLVTAVTSAKGTVTQTNTAVSSAASYYNILFSNAAADTTTRTDSVRKSAYLFFDTKDSTLTTGNLVASSTVYAADVSNLTSTWDGTNTSLKTAIGNKISDIKLIKVNIPCTSLTKNMSLATYVTSSLPSGYTFIGWQSCGCTNGWVSTFSFYLANVLSSTGSPWWEGALNTNTGCGVDFYYFAIKK